MLAPYQRILDGQLPGAPDQAQALIDPIGIGAVGGSGTRLIQQILVDAGVAMASPLNRAGDAFEWPPWQKLLSEEMIARHGRQTLVAHSLAALEQLLLERRERLGMSGRGGWKVPGTFHWLPDLGTYFSGFQYIHLLRNGLDMAYSGNQNQIKNWAHKLGVAVRYQDNGRIHPNSMLEYWLCANELAINNAQQSMPGRMLTLHFEQLCADPRPELRKLFDFLSLPIDEAELEQLAALVEAPQSINRYREQPWQKDFTDDQLLRLEQFGYRP